MTSSLLPLLLLLLQGEGLRGRPALVAGAVDGDDREGVTAGLELAQGGRRAAGEEAAGVDLALEGRSGVVGPELEGRGLVLGLARGAAGDLDGRRGGVGRRRRRSVEIEAADRRRRVAGRVDRADAERV